MEKEFCRHGNVVGECPSDECEKLFLATFNDVENFEENTPACDEKGPGTDHYNEVMFGV